MVKTIMAEGNPGGQGGPALDDAHTVRSRLIASFAAALALSVAWGPFCGFTDLLRTEPPSPFFWPSRYMWMIGVMCVVASLVACVIAVPCVALTAWAWRRFGDRTQRWALVMGLGFLGLLVLGQLDLIPYSTDYTTGMDLAVSSNRNVPELAFAAIERLAQGIYVILLNHY